MARKRDRRRELCIRLGVGLAGALGLLTLPTWAEAVPLIGLTSTNTLVSFDSAAPGTIGANVAITGLQAGETLLAIDRRPADGVLYGMGSSDLIYTIDTATGAAAAVGSGFIPSLSGTSFGFDFSPVADRIRVVSTDASDFRLNPNDGALAGTDTALTYAPGDSGAGVSPRVVGSAYTNNFDGTAVSTLFGIDSNRDVLVMQGGVDGVPSPDGGVLVTIGTGLGFNTSDVVGFDISGPSGLAFAALTPTGGASQLFTIDLASGFATLLGTIGTGSPITGLAADVGMLAVPEPSRFVLFGIGLGLIAFGVRRRFQPPKRPCYQATPSRMPSSAASSRRWKGLA